MHQECVVQECKDANCPRIIEQEWEETGALIPVCSTYVVPRAWWRRGICPFVYKHKAEMIDRKRVGQQKQKRKK